MTNFNDFLKSNQNNESALDSNKIEEGIGTIALGVMIAWAGLKLIKGVAKKVVGKVGMRMTLEPEKLKEVLDNVIETVASQSGSEADMLKNADLKMVIYNKIDSGEIRTIEDVQNEMESYLTKNEGVVSESKITLKRQYTENHPAITVGKAARIRNKMLEAIADGTITQEEFNAILREMSTDTGRWMRRNSKFFNVSEEGISLSKFGKKALSNITVNESEMINEGQFSWMAQDTGRQIGSERENRITVYMYDNQGNKWKESKYDGYGEFGGMDYYELLAKMNGYHEEDLEDMKGLFSKELRLIGIKLAFGELKTKDKKGKVLFPALVEDPRYNWKRHDFTQEAENDPNQSWYEEEEDEDEYMWNESNKENINMKNNFVFESFSAFVDSLELNEAFKSSLLASLFTRQGKFDSKLAKAFYSTTRVKMDQIEDEDLLVVDPNTAYKNKEEDTIVFYISDTEKENPYAPRDAWGENKVIPGEGYLLAVASGDNTFYTQVWGGRYGATAGEPTLKKSDSQTDTIGINKKYKGWDGTGLYNVKRISEVADRAVIVNTRLLQQKYSSAAQRAERAAAKKGATAFKSDKDFKKENMDRYREILANKAASLPLDSMVSDAIETIGKQIKDGLAKGEKGRYGDIIIGRKANGSEAKMRDAANHMSNILDDYNRYVSYIAQSEESYKKYGDRESFYEREAKTYAKSVKDKIDQIESFDYVW